MPQEPCPAALAYPAALADSELFHGWDPAAFKLYFWLRARIRRAEPGGEPRRGYLIADASGAELEAAIGVSKNTVTKLARTLQDLEVATFESDRAGYHFRLGEWHAQRATGLDLELAAEVFYLEARLLAPGRAERG